MVRIIREKTKNSQNKSLHSVRVARTISSSIVIAESPQPTLKVGSIEYYPVALSDKRPKSIEGKQTTVVIDRARGRSVRLCLIAKVLVHTNMKSLRMLGEDIIDRQK